MAGFAQSIRDNWFMTNADSDKTVVQQKVRIPRGLYAQIAQYFADERKRDGKKRSYQGLILGLLQDAVSSEWGPEPEPDPDSMPVPVRVPGELYSKLENRFNEAAIRGEHRTFQGLVIGLLMKEMGGKPAHSASTETVVVPKAHAPAVREFVRFLDSTLREDIHVREFMLMHLMNPDLMSRRA